MKDFNNLKGAFDQGGLILFCPGEGYNVTVPEHSRQSFDALNSVFGETVYATDTVLSPMASKWMCSEQCPCETSAFAAYGRVPEGEYQFYNRTRDQADTDDTDGDVRMVIQGKTGDIDKDYFPASFYDCYKDWDRDWNNQSSRAKNQVPTGWYAPAQ